MATTTTNLGLTKPSGSEKVNISTINGNMDLIDTFAGGVNTNIGKILPVITGTTNNSGYAISAGDYFEANGTLYKATAAIPKNSAWSSSATAQGDTVHGALNGAFDTLNSNVDYCGEIKTIPETVQATPEAIVAYALTNWNLEIPLYRHRHFHFIRTNVDFGSLELYKTEGSYVHGLLYWKRTDTKVYKVSGTFSSPVVEELALNSNLAKLDSATNTTNDILSDALTCSRTSIFRATGSSYTGNVPSTEYKYGAFIVNIWGGIRLIIAQASNGEVATNAYSGTAWGGWEILALNSNLNSGISDRADRCRLFRNTTKAAIASELTSTYTGDFVVFAGLHTVTDMANGYYIIMQRGYISSDVQFFKLGT